VPGDADLRDPATSLPVTSIDDLLLHPALLRGAGRAPAAAKPYALLRERASPRAGRVGRRHHRAAPSASHLAALEAGGPRRSCSRRCAGAHEHPLAVEPRPALAHDPAARFAARLALALRLIETLAADWDPKRYKDTYREVLLGIIETQGGRASRSARPGSSVSRRLRSLMSAASRPVLRERKAPLLKSRAAVTAHAA